MSLEDWAAKNRDMVPHLGTLRDLAAQCKEIVEFGVRGGVSTWAFLDGLPADGHLWSVDVDDCWLTVPDRVRDDPRWTFLHGSDLDEAIHAQLPADADLVFIDTSHEFDHTVLELGLALGLDPYWIVCHDADWDGVANAIAEFCLDHNWLVSRFVEAHDEKGPFSLAVLEPA